MAALLIPILKMKRSSKILVLKKFEADNNEVVKNSSSCKANEIIRILAKFKNIKKLSKIKQFLKTRRSE